MEEAWLSGKIENVPPILMPAAHALLQAMRDIELNVKNLSVEQLWSKPNGAASVGFHLLHIAGSVDRLLTYARGGKLSDAHFAELAAENKPDDLESAEMLAWKAVEQIEKAISEMKTTAIEKLFEERFVGRKRLPTNVFGLLFHIAEHTQRHVEQIITAAKIVRSN